VLGKYLEDKFRDSLDTGTGLGWGVSALAIGLGVMKFVDSIFGLPSELFFDDAKSTSLVRPILAYWFGSMY